MSPPHSDLSPNATLPSRGSPLSAGYDLYSAVDLEIEPQGGRALVATDISIAVPEGTYGRVAPRSGLALKKGIDVGAGVCGCGLSGSTGSGSLQFGSGTLLSQEGGSYRSAHLRESIVYPEIKEVDSLESTERGDGGFGSTGAN
ncbi:dut [Lepeophtheirus salmonis]|uniref:Deoxyuridine 5'-triphosphate nucleotidohydrolase n=1 Tax=Lepeophtheirus salmonis TaxID=72036 RepID=A0A7R8H4K2_LEPSM|nr:dut [Lepeophtheirus salmonis]CAF2848368.1 dut [Lepeophtheirus salmonis]